MNSSSIPTHLREKRSRTTLKALIGTIFSENKIILLHYIHSPVFHWEIKFITIQLSFTTKFIITLCVENVGKKKKNCLFLRNHVHCGSENGTLGNLEGIDVYFHGMFSTEQQ